MIQLCFGVAAVDVQIWRLLLVGTLKTGIPNLVDALEKKG
jgi:hypothetical protein